MSASRRAAAADDNILARLERDAKRSPAASSWKNHATLAWCALAAMAIIGLIGVLASLAKENLASHRKSNLLDAKATPDLVLSSGFAPLPMPERRIAMPIAMTDMPSESPTLPSLVRDRAPPLVLLPTSARTAAPVAKPDAEPLPPVHVAAAKATAKPSPPARVVAAKPITKNAPAKPAAQLSRPASTAVSAPPRPVITLAPAPRPKKVAVAAAPAKAEPVVDGDVALLSAIIMHANRHSAERAQMEAAQCGAGKKSSSTDAAAAALKDSD
jgi:hypothetical protein